MHPITILDKQFELFITQDQITTEILRITTELQHKYFIGKVPVFIIVANGALRFASDILKYYNGDCEIRCIRMSSYNGDETSGTVKTVFGLDDSLKGRDVIIIEDIIDTGKTVHELREQLTKLSVGSIEVCTALFKPDACEYDDARPDYWGFVVDNLFVVGYGMDYKEQGRNLNGIWKPKA
jgi:hypoxanthine phosphoribosyltransferase